MVIHTVHFLALTCIFSFTPPALAKNSKGKGFLDYLGFATQLQKPMPRPPNTRPTQTNIKGIERDTDLKDVDTNDMQISGCLQTSKYNHKSIMDEYGQASRVITNNAKPDIEQISIQPHFSGLKGPKITIMRKDFESSLIDKQGSAQEIFHNAQITPQSGKACDSGFTYQSSYALHHHIDLNDSDKAPLVRTSLKWENEFHFGGYFLGTISSRHLLYDNLDKEPDLNILDKPKTTRQDVIAFHYQSFNLERFALSGFATPMPNLYIAAHGGYLEEMFFGIGGEMLYRPFDKRFSLGFEAWATQKRLPYLGGYLALDDDNSQSSFLLNGWYDMPRYPVSFGVSAGRFLDGDYGVQARTRWSPKPGWRVEGFATLSNEKDKSLDNDKTTNIIAGMKLVMPLGNIKYLPKNLRQEFVIEPFARDKGQRIDNPYPLYDLTSDWTADNIYKNWNDITK